MRVSTFARRAVGVALALAFVAAAVPGRADDRFPPPWRGAPGSDFQQWEFFTQSPFPEIANNPYGQPAITDISTSTWLPGFGGHDGVWCIPDGGQMVFHIPDDEDPAQIKYVRIQVTVLTDTGGFNWLGSPTNTYFESYADGWTYSYADYIIQCAPYDVYFYGGPLYLDEVVVDSICVPEPFSLAGLGIGALALVRRRRNRA